MKLRFVLFSLVLVALLFSAGGQAYAMTPEQQAMYDAWYQARFGTPRTPQTPTPTQLRHPRRLPRTLGPLPRRAAFSRRTQCFETQMVRF